MLPCRLGLRQTLLRDRPPIFLEIQRGNKSRADGSNRERVEDLLYPDHLIFEVAHSHGNILLRPSSPGGADEALVLPAELAGIVPDSRLH